MLFDHLWGPNRGNLLYWFGLIENHRLNLCGFKLSSLEDEGKSILKVKQMYFSSNADIKPREKEDNEPYIDLAEQGSVQFYDGKMIDQDKVLEYIKE